MEQLIEAVRTIKDEKDSALSPSEREHNQQAKRVASGALAIREVSEKALGDQWRKLTPAQQADFIRLVTDLFETVAYPKSSGFFGDLTIEFGDERITGERAVVKTTVRHPKEGRVGIDYKLERRGNQWLIHDILLDEVSLALDLRSQIQKVLREESYARLIERMREKLNEG